MNHSKVTEQPTTNSGKRATTLTLVKSQIRDDSGVLRVSSRDVAKDFDKRHDNVLQAIASLECPNDFRLLNFQEKKIKVLTGTGEETAEVLMTFDGWTFLVMGFTGAKAARFKVLYIQAFNEMREELRARNIQPAPTSSLALLEGMLSEIKGQDARLTELSARIDEAVASDSELRDTPTLTPDEQERVISACKEKARMSGFTGRKNNERGIGYILGAIKRRFLAPRMLKAGAKYYHIPAERLDDVIAFIAGWSRSSRK